MLLQIDLAEEALKVTPFSAYAYGFVVLILVVGIFLVRKYYEEQIARINTSLEKELEYSRSLNKSILEFEVRVIEVVSQVRQRLDDQKTMVSLMEALIRSQELMAKAQEEIKKELISHHDSMIYFREKTKISKND